jgi:hypothetical protein
MAVDVLALQTAYHELAEAVANIQRGIDQTQQRQALLAQALFYAACGQWYAAVHGSQSVEAILVAISPSWQGKFSGVPFEGRRERSVS